MDRSSHLQLVCSEVVAASLLLAGGLQTTLAESALEVGAWNPDVAAAVMGVFQGLPPPAVHYAGLSEAEAARLLRSDAAYQQLRREKLEGHWFAALVATAGPEPYSIQARFETWQDLVEFLAEQNALVEVWACGGGVITRSGVSRQRSWLI
jgi:hypothetical protein